MRNGNTQTVRVLIGKRATTNGVPDTVATGAVVGGTILAPGSSVLVRTAEVEGKEIQVSVQDCLMIPSSLPAGVGLLVPALTSALWAWDDLGLEIGEVAVYTSGSPYSGLIGQVALWRGGCPVIQLGSDANRPPIEGVDAVGVDDQDNMLAELKRLMQNKPGFAAIDFTGRPDIIDALLEALPRWGRLMLASRATQPLTVDYYNNVHRKGAVVSACVLDADLVFASANRRRAVLAHLERACKILENPAMAAMCLRHAEGLVGVP